MCGWSKELVGSRLESGVGGACGGWGRLTFCGDTDPVKIAREFLRDVGLPPGG